MTAHTLMAAVTAAMALAASNLPACILFPTRPPLVVALDRPESLAAAPVPNSLDEALEALARGMSGAVFLRMQRETEENAVESSLSLAAWIERSWIAPAESGLRSELAAAGVQQGDMPEVVLRSFWRRLHDLPVDLTAQVRQAAARTTVERMTPRSVIFPQERALELTRQCGRPVPQHVTGTWTPYAATIAQLERELTPALQQALDRTPSLDQKMPRASEYYRQYGGLIAGGRHIVYVNGFHETYVSRTASIGLSSRSWRHRAVWVCDGGYAFFGAEYDPATGQVSALVFN